MQDVFICPSRKERITNPQPDSEYGTTLRVYNPRSGAWNILYGCTNEATSLEARMENGEIVLTEKIRKKMKWIFSEITEKSFHWRCNIMNDSSKWETVGELYATRRK